MAAINLDAALVTFFAEADELLGQIELSVLELELRPDDVEELNALFRCAHTIKGSAGLFGLTAIVAFTHHLETLLDELRNGSIRFDANLSTLAFDCRDHLARLLGLARDAAEPDAQDVEREAGLLARMQALLAGSAKAATVDPSALDGSGPEPGNTAGRALPDAPAEAGGAGSGDRWRIRARFGPSLFRDGFDPLSILAYLGTIGQLVDVRVVLPAELSMRTVDPETCHLGLDIDLRSEAACEQIEGAFQFVREDTELSIEAMSESRARVSPVAAVDSAPSTVSEAVPVRSRESRADDQRMVRIPAEKLDQLINLVGELVIAGAGAHALAQTHRYAALAKSTKKVNSLVEEVRNGALAMRMVPIGETFARFRRVVRDVCADLGKQVELELHGTEAELDKSVVEKIVDPLMHIVRNALDHGIEPPAERMALGKPASGRLLLTAFHDSGQVVIQIVDDGRGLSREKILAKAIERGVIAPGAALSDADILDLIFAPGFSTAESVTNLSGRGVGMDVVKRNIESLRGSVLLRSDPGHGTTVEIRLPLTLAIIDGFLVRVGRSHLVLPLEVVAECINTDALVPPAQGAATGLMSLRGSVLPVVFLRQLFRLSGPGGARQSIVVVRSGGRQAGLVVDSLAGEYQTVIKPLGRMFRHLKGIAGSTILGSGEVALILDIAALVALAGKQDNPIPSPSLHPVAA